LAELPQWLMADLAGISRQYRQKTLPHGLLVIGHPGDGSAFFMDELVAKLLCQADAELACGTCKSCQLQASGCHPDYLKVEPEGKSLTIKVDAIRSINRKISETAQQGGNKVVYLQNAEKMNINAANAVLKVLEEPTDNTFILLESSELSKTLPTVRSRCRIVSLNTPSTTESVQFLEGKGSNVDALTALGISEGHPFDALKLKPDDISDWFDQELKFLQTQGFSELSQYIQGRSLESILKQMLLWVDIALRSQLKSEVAHAPVSDGLLQSLVVLTSVSLFGFRDYIVDKLSALNRQSNLNTQLMGEELASRWLSLRGMQ